MSIGIDALIIFAEAVKSAITGEDYTSTFTAGKTTSRPTLEVLREALDYLDDVSRTAVQKWLDAAATFNPDRKDLVPRSKAANQFAADCKAIGINTGVKPPPWREPPDDWYRFVHRITNMVCLVDCVSYDLDEMHYKGTPLDEPAVIKLARGRGYGGQKPPVLVVMREGQGSIATIHGGVQFRILLGVDTELSTLLALVPQEFQNCPGEEEAVVRGCFLKAEDGEPELTVSETVWNNYVVSAIVATVGDGEYESFPCPHCGAVGRTSRPSLEEPRGTKCPECGGMAAKDKDDWQIWKIRQDVLRFLSSNPENAQLPVTEVIGLLSAGCKLNEVAEERADKYLRNAEWTAKSERSAELQLVRELRTWLESAAAMAATIPALGGMWVARDQMELIRRNCAYAAGLEVRDDAWKDKDVALERIYPLINAVSCAIPPGPEVGTLIELVEKSRAKCREYFDQFNKR